MVGGPSIFSGFGILDSPDVLKVIHVHPVYEGFSTFEVGGGVPI